MADSIEIISSGRLLEVHATGKLTKDFYEKLVPAVEAQIKKNGKLDILFIMHDFHGWTAGALWEDCKFEMKHCHDIERLAVVGESKWQQGMATFCKPFVKAKIQYFEHNKIDDARKWVTGN